MRERTFRFRRRSGRFGPSVGGWRAKKLPKSPFLSQKNRRKLFDLLIDLNKGEEGDILNGKASIPNGQKFDDKDELDFD